MDAFPGPSAGRGRAHAIILYGDLAKAVKRESSLAICYWFGVGADTAWKWRQALGVERENEGTSRTGASRRCHRMGKQILFSSNRITRVLES